MKKIMHTLSFGDNVYLDTETKTITIEFRNPRKILSTEIFNGGYQENLKGIYNHTCDETETYLLAPTYEEHLRLLTQRIDLDPESMTGMSTGVDVRNTAIRTESFENLTVTAIVTAGIENNAGRAGDPTDNYFPVDKTILQKPGTINIILAIDADMPSGIMARALVTCTEAKTAAIQELMVGSLYSNGLATGSGTDQTIIIANPSSELYFEFAGKHSKLGELIGKAVKNAVKEALFKETGLSPNRQHSILRRLKRFGVTEQSLFDTYVTKGGNLDILIFQEKLKRYEHNADLVTYTSLYVHLLDEFNWGLLSGEEVKDSGNVLIVKLAEKFDCVLPMITEMELDHFIGIWEKSLAVIIGR